jgi:hypothetical protein
MPDRNTKRKGGRPEFEIAYYTKELGPAVQRKLLEQQLARLSEDGKARRGHGEDAAPEPEPPPPEEDRAG